MRRLGILLAALLLLSPVAALAHPRVELDTTEGTIVLELYENQAPVTVANFLQYVKSGFYDGTIFHRVIPGFMIQGGGFTESLHQKPTRKPIENEADNGLENERGTIAMARTSVPNSATSQFFINLVNNSNLNYRDDSRAGAGYAVFGKVIKGMDVVDRIAQVPTGTTALQGYPARNVPKTPVVIEHAKRLDSGAQSTTNDDADE